MVVDPGVWTWRGAWGREPQLEAACRTLAGHLLEDDRAGSINRLVHHLRLDAVELHGILEAIGFEGGKVPDDERLQLDLLQALRLALIFRVFILSAQLPRFATRNDISHEQILRQALALEIPEVLVFIRRIFPHRAELSDDARFDEPASYRPQGMDDYGRLESEILEPLEQAYELVREIGTGIAHHFGAFG
jgi:phosphoenolpyruvate carboxylase